MSNKRKISDFFLQTVTYGSAVFSLVILTVIVIYVFSNGTKLLNKDLITNNYLAVNYIAEVIEDEFLCMCENDKVYPNDVYYSSKWGIALYDDENLLGKTIVSVYDVHPYSPLKDMVNKGVSDEKIRT